MKKITLFIITIFVSFLSFSQQYEVSSFYNASAFNDISTTGTALNISDDGEENITTSFPITLGNDQSTQLRIGNNGAILFGTTTGNVMATGTHDLETSLPMIAPLWSDLDDESGNVYWQDSGSLVIIQWDRPHYNDSSSNGVFQVKFFNSGDFYFIYQDVDFGDVDFNEGADATIGIATSQEVFQFSKNTASVHTDFVIKFEPMEVTNIPDDNFEAYLETHNASGDTVVLGAADSMGNGVLDDNTVYTSRIENITNLDVSGYAAADDSEKISDLTGIEDFTALTYLECSVNLLTTLDVSQNINLVTLRCRVNNLTTLNVDTNVNLTELNCSANQLSEINIDNNVALEWFACYQNFNISTLNLVNNTALTYVNCHFMNLTELNTSQNTNLETLECYGNDITTLNLDNNVNLKKLFCGGNEFTSLSLNNNTALELFNCTNSDNLSSLIIQNGTNGLLSGMVTSGGQTFPRFNAGGCPSLSCIYVDNVSDAITGINDYVDWSIDTTSNYVANDIECNATYPVPSNNDCANATNLIVGANFETHAITTTNVGSTYTTGVDPSCVEPEQPEIWFTVTVPDSGNLIIETQPVDGSDFNDSIIAAFTGTCDNLTELACNDDSNVEDTYFSLIELSDLTPGDILYITAYSFEGEPFGEFKISAYDSSLASIQNNTITGLSIYPNPVENTLFIKTSNTIDSIQIYNMLGQVVLTKSPLLNNMELDLSNLSSGNYIVKIQSNNQIGTYKLIKK